MGKPETIELKDLRSHFKKKIDLFICSASFEDRCLQIAKNLPKKVSRTLIFKNKFEKEETSKGLKTKNAKYISELFTNSSVIPISKSDPFFTSDQMFRNIWKYKKNKQITVVIDITTFTHEALLILFKIIDILTNSRDSIYYLYNPAQEYCFKTKNIYNKWLSKGIKEVRSVLGYPGYFSPYRKLHLIVMVGYEVERCISLIEKYEPSALSFGIPKERNFANEKIHELNVTRYKKLLSIYPLVNEFKFSVVDPEETKKALMKQVKTFDEYNTVVAPMNNKISTLGAGLLVRQINKVQICYAKANIYNTEDYSLYSSKCIVLT